MTEEKKSIFQGRGILYIIIGIMIILMCWNFYTQRNWSQGRLCISESGGMGWYIYEPYNCSSGYLFECKDIKTKNNAWVQSCECRDWGINTTGHYRICPEFIEIWRFKE